MFLYFLDSKMSMILENIIVLLTTLPGKKFTLKINKKKLSSKPTSSIYTKNIINNFNIIS